MMGWRGSSLMVSLLAVLAVGCTWIRKQTAHQAWLCELPGETDSELLPGEDPSGDTNLKKAKKTPFFFYIRAKRIPQPEPSSKAPPVHHMCWYQAELDRDFASETDFEQALQENPASIKTKSLHGIFTPSSVLATGLLASLKKNPDLLSKSGLAMEVIDLSRFDRLLLGNEASVIGVIPALASLIYFGGQFAAPPDGDAGAVSRSIASKGAPTPPPQGKEGQANQGAQQTITQNKTLPTAAALPRLDQEVSDFITKTVQEHGITNPPESLLRLPIESLAEYPCPEY